MDNSRVNFFNKETTVSKPVRSTTDPDLDLKDLTELSMQEADKLRERGLLDAGNTQAQKDEQDLSGEQESLIRGIELYIQLAVAGFSKDEAVGALCNNLEKITGVAGTPDKEKTINEMVSHSREFLGNGQTATEFMKAWETA